MPSVYAILPAPCTTAPLFSTHCTKHLSDRSKISFVFHADILSHDSEVSCHPPSLPWCIKFLLVPTLLHCKLFIINYPSIILILRAVLSSVTCSARQIMSPSFNISKLHQLTHLKKLLNLIKPKNELQHHLPKKTLPPTSLSSQYHRFHHILCITTFILFKFQSPHC